MTEAEIQNRLWKHCDDKRHRLIVPNVTFFGWESDLISVTTSDFIVEFEIKCSRSDFRADLKKWRHRVLDPLQIGKHKRGPSSLYYVTPADLVQPEEIPLYAGLIYFPLMTVRRKAPRLHSNKITDNQRRWIERSLTMRYWKARLRRVGPTSSILPANHIPEE